MRVRFGFAVLWALSSVAAVGCNGSDVQNADKDGGASVQRDASGPARVGEVWRDPELTGFDASVPDAARFVEPDDAGSDPVVIDTTVISNTPNAKFENPLNPDKTLRLVSSNFLQDSSTSNIFQEWYAEVENVGHGKQILCLASVTVEFYDSYGKFTSFNAYINGPAYDTGFSTSSTDCIAPGEHAAMYANGFASNTYSLDSISKIVVTWDGLLRPNAIPHPLLPHVDSIQVEADHSLSGQMTSAAYAIYNLESDAYLRDASGLIFTTRSAFHADTFEPATKWMFTTNPAPTSFTDYLFSTSFIAGRL